VYRLAAVDLALQRVGDLDLAAPAGRGVAQRVEDARGQHVTPDDREVARCLFGRRLLDQVGDPDDALAVGRLEGDAAVERDRVPRHLEQRHHAATLLGLHVQHRPEQFVPLVDQVVAEQHSEHLVADERIGAEDGVPETARVALPDEVHGGQFG